MSTRFQAGELRIPDVWASFPLPIPRSYTLGENPETHRLTQAGPFPSLPISGKPFSDSGRGRGGAKGSFYSRHGLFIPHFYC